MNPLKKSRNLSKRPFALSVGLSLLLSPIVALSPAPLAQASSASTTEEIVGTFYQIAYSPEVGSLDHEDAISAMVETESGEIYELSGLTEDEITEVPSGVAVEITGEVVSSPDASQAGEINLATAQGNITQTQANSTTASQGQSSGIEPVGQSFSLGDKKIAIILLKLGANGVADITPAIAQQTYFTGPNAIAKFIAATSFGKTTISGLNDPNGDVYGYLTIPADTGCRGHFAAGQAAVAAAGLDLSGYDYLSYVIDDAAVAGCGYSGYATIGGNTQVIVSYSTNITVPAIIGHELGHNFGLHHAKSMQCLDSTGQPVSLVQANVGCGLTEYGDIFDTMGTAWNEMPFGAPQKVRLGWIPQTNVAIADSSGEFDIYPASIETTNTQVLQVPGAIADDNLYIDFRQVTNAFETPVGNYPALVNGVSVRKMTGGMYSKIVDLTPATVTAADAPLLAGQSLVDPNTGITIELLSVSSTKARVKVTYPNLYPQVYLRGTNNNWSTSTLMTLVPGTDHIWETLVDFTGASNDRFKFDIHGDWTLNFGDNNNDGVAEQTGGDIYITQGAGTYKITFNSITKQYTVVKPPLADAGADFEVPVGQYFTLNSTGSTSQDNPIVLRTWACCEEIAVPSGATAPYFNVNGGIFYTPGVYQATLKVSDAAGNYTTDTVLITAIVDVPPVAVVTNTTYDVSVGQSVTFDASGSYDPEGGELTYLWACCTYKYGSWSHFKANAAVTSFTFTSPGTYTPVLQVSDSYGQMSQISVTVNVTDSGNESFTGNYAQVYLRGTHNAWANDVQMTLVADNTWQAEVSFGSTSSERFKFDINGDWTLNFGDNNNDGVADQTGSDIAISQGAGQYRIVFNDQTKAYTVTKI